jgi:molybdopterin-guanine dinucleotide biosynthesis protein A
MPLPEFSAVVLAAGLSTRMGRDKALLEIEGVPLWRRQCEVLRRAGAAEVFISAREEQSWARGENVVRDAVAGAGPLAGIVAALERATDRHLAVLAVDLPKMEAKWFQSLLAECSDGVGAVARRTGNPDFFEPLAAVYPREMLGLARAALARGEFTLQRLLNAAEIQGLVRVRSLGADESALFDNWNEPHR